MSAPLVAKAAAVSRVTSIPWWIAARGFAPSTSSRVPNEVRERMTWTTTATASAIRTPTWIRVPGRFQSRRLTSIGWVCGTIAGPLKTSFKIGRAHV